MRSCCAARSSVPFAAARARSSARARRLDLLHRLENLRLGVGDRRARLIDLVQEHLVGLVRLDLVLLPFELLDQRLAVGHRGFVAALLLLGGDHRGLRRLDGGEPLLALLEQRRARGRQAALLVLELGDLHVDARELEQRLDALHQWVASWSGRREDIVVSRGCEAHSAATDRRPPSSWRPTTSRVSSRWCSRRSRRRAIRTSTW